MTKLTKPVIAPASNPTVEAIAMHTGFKTAVILAGSFIGIAIYLWEITWPLRLPFHFFHGMFGGLLGVDINAPETNYDQWARTGAEAFAFYLTLGIYTAILLTLLNIRH